MAWLEDPPLHPAKVLETLHEWPVPPMAISLASAVSVARVFQCRNAAPKLESLAQAQEQELEEEEEVAAEALMMQQQLLSWASSAADL